MLMFMQVQQPKTVEEAHALMVKQKMAPILAGGCWTRLGNRKWPMVIDLSELGLRYIEEDETEYRIGAMATQRDVEVYEPFKTFCRGVLPNAVKDILGVQFRSMATMGGSVAAKFGFSDIIPALLALQAEVRLFEAGRMPIEQYLTYGTRDLLLEIIGCRPGKPALATKACQLINEKGLDALDEAVTLIQEELSFQSNSHAGAEYRLEMAKNMFKRLVKEVAQWK